ncbi:MAG: 16S rRNA (cytosine(1402)-N(4))-methyltransferase RsmH [Actinomycetota bacterium]|nr:16S rRNA (cytosine(1402)-N(4))-methyltransferase RsmH [Actinomycetota bacterium]
MSAVLSPSRPAVAIGFPPGAAKLAFGSSLSANARGDDGAPCAGAASGGLQHAAPARGQGDAPTTPFAHEPVMLAEVLALLGPLGSGLVIDATVGGAGHAQAILDQRDDLCLLGLDRDPEAVVVARERLARFGERARVERARFDHLGDALAAERARRGADRAQLPLVAVLFDLGVSSHQLDVAERGFSYRHGGPLDMRMDPEAGPSAQDVVNSWDEARLAALFAEHGEERFARRIARAVIAARPIHRTDALAEVVASALPAAARRRGHPARRVFQALRVAVNEELEQLPGAIDDAIAALASGGRCVVLAYHSGEDRIVKERFREAATGGCVCPPGLPCGCGARPLVRLLTRSSRQASSEEKAANPRADAARLRAVERLAETEESHA